MSDSAQNRAIKNYRARLVERGMARFEVIGRETDRRLIRLFAKRLAEDGEDSERLRARVRQDLFGQPRQKGGILAALRRSPLVGEDLIPSRAFEPGREIDL